MARIEASIVINRPIEDLFEYMADVARNTEWKEGILEAKQTSPGPAAVGATYTYVVQAMGRKIETDGEITEFQAPTRFAWKSTKSPFPMTGGHTLEPANGGVKVTNFMEVEPGGFFKLAEGIMAKQQKSQMERELANLKAMMEG